MGERVQVLDHGYIELVESWGSDERIIESARMSTAKGFVGWGPWCAQCGAMAIGGKYPDGKCPKALAGDSSHYMTTGDEKLLRFLYENKHSTPFEMAGATFEVQAPIFVFREWHRHRTQSYSELSARYTPLPDVNYIPTVERLMMGSDGKNKQAGTVKDAKALTEVRAHNFQDELARSYAHAQELYESALAAGVPKELARVHLPVGRYSRMRASTDLRNWLGFLALRCAPSAQWEIRQYADAVRAELVKLFPRTLELFNGGAK
jgi:thymidylate synthase (FAD)